MARDAQRTIGGWNESHEAAPLLLTVPDARRATGGRIGRPARPARELRGDDEAVGMASHAGHDAAQAADADGMLEQVVLWLRSDAARIVLWLIVAAVALSLAAYYQGRRAKPGSAPSITDPTSLHRRISPTKEATLPRPDDAPLTSDARPAAPPQVRITRLQSEPPVAREATPRPAASLTQKVDQILQSRYVDTGAAPVVPPREKETIRRGVRR